MFELVPSKFMRECYKEMGFQFSDFEKATLIWNAPGKTVQEKMDALKELADKTDDDYLKKQIEERLNYENKALEVFMDNSSGKYVYVVELKDCCERIGFFGNYDSAFKYSLKYMDQNYDETCCIEKQRIVSSDEDEYTSILLECPDKESIYSEYNGEPDAEISLSYNGDICFFNSKELPEEMKIVNSLNRERFENHFVDIHYPAKSAMCVRDINTGTYGIVIDNAKDWNEYTKLIEDRKLPVDYTDSVLTMMVLNESGFWTHEHVNPLYLEPENPSYISGNKKSVAFYHAMIAMSNYFLHHNKKEWERDALMYSKRYAEVCYNENEGAKSVHRINDINDIFDILFRD